LASSNARIGRSSQPKSNSKCFGKISRHGFINVLKERGGFREDIPTLFAFEAVLFYVEEDAIQDIVQDLASFMGAWKERGAEALLCMTGE
jgi:O-methyltransferase involved in polyketide biosynthesis